MADFESAEFKIAWARIVAQAAVDAAFRQRLEKDAKSVFAEHGCTDATEKQLADYVKAHLQAAIDAVEHSQDAAGSAEAPAGDTAEAPPGPQPAPQGSPQGNCALCFPCYPCAGPTTGTGTAQGTQSPAQLGDRTMATSSTMMCSGTTGQGLSATTMCQATTGCLPTTASYPCAGTYIGSQAASTRLTGGAGRLSTSVQPNAFDCWGSAATFGSYGSFCGTAGTAGTAGSFGSAVAAETLPSAGAGRIGATMSPCYCATQASTGSQGTAPPCWGASTSAGSTRLSGTAASPAAFDCLGSFGSAGSFGSVCGTAGTAATAGTFGSAVAAETGGATVAASSTRLTGTAGSMGARIAAPAGPAAFDCWGSAGTFGSYGTFCGSAGSVGSAGSFGSAVTAETGGRLNNAGTLGSFATFCGGIGGASSTCWGTMFSN